MYTVEPVPRVVYIDLRILNDRALFTPTRAATRIHRQGLCRTWKRRTWAGKARNFNEKFQKNVDDDDDAHGKREKWNQRRHIANSLRQRLSPLLDHAPWGAFFIDVERI